MKHLFVNNATSALSIDTAASSITLTVMGSDGAKFPQPAGDGTDGFAVTIEDRRNRTLEVCFCTDRAGDVLSVLRGQEGTTAQYFGRGSTVSNRLTAKVMTDFQEIVTNVSDVWSKTEGDERYVNVTGDQMSGPLYLPLAAPTFDEEAVNNKYVNDTFALKVHTHDPDDITGLADVLDTKVEEAPIDGNKYIRQNAHWQMLTLDGVAGGITGLVTISETAPGQPIDNQLWWSNASGKLFIRYHDLDSAQWVQVNSSAGFVGEAPIDGQRYERVNGAWAPTLAPGTPEVANEAPADGRSYLRNGQNKGWIAGLPLSGGALSGTLATVGYQTRAGMSGAYGNNWFNFYWTGSRLQVWVDSYNAGIIAYTSELGNYVAKAGDSMTGNLYSSIGFSTDGYFYATNYIQANNVHSNNYSVVGSGSTQTGGVLGYNAGNSLYQISGYGGYGAYGNGIIYTSSEVRGQGYVRSLGASMIAAGHSTTTNSPTVWMNSGGTIYRCTSSLAFKQNVEPLGAEFADKILKLKPIFYRPGKNTDDRQDWSRFGLGAEDCYKVDPRFAITETKIKRDANGRQIIATRKEKGPNPEHHKWLCNGREGPEPTAEITVDMLTGEVIPIEGEIEQTAIDTQGILAALIKLVQLQQKQIDRLEGLIDGRL